MKKQLFLAGLVLNAYAQDEKPSTNEKKETYEELKKEFEQLRYKPTSHQHFSWMARCEKNEECKKKTRENFKKISHEELTELMIEEMLVFDGFCTHFEEKKQEFNKIIKKVKKDTDQIEKTIQEIQSFSDAYKKFRTLNRIYHFVSAGLLLTGGTLCAITKNNTGYVKLLGSASIALGLLSLVRVFVG